MSQDFSDDKVVFDEFIFNDGLNLGDKENMFSQLKVNNRITSSSNNPVDNLELFVSKGLKTNPFPSSLNDLVVCTFGEAFSLVKKGYGFLTNNLNAKFFTDKLKISNYYSIISRSGMLDSLSIMEQKVERIEQVNEVEVNIDKNIKDIYFDGYLQPYDSCGDYTYLNKLGSDRNIPQNFDVRNVKYVNGISIMPGVTEVGVISPLVRRMIPNLCDLTVLGIIYKSLCLMVSITESNSTSLLILKDNEDDYINNNCRVEVIPWSSTNTVNTLKKEVGTKSNTVKIIIPAGKENVYSKLILMLKLTSVPFLLCDSEGNKVNWLSKNNFRDCNNLNNILVFAERTEVFNSEYENNSNYNFLKDKSWYTTFERLIPNLIPITKSFYLADQFLLNSLITFNYHYFSSNLSFNKCPISQYPEVIGLFEVIEPQNLGNIRNEITLSDFMPICVNSFLNVQNIILLTIVSVLKYGMKQFDFKDVNKYIFNDQCKVSFDAISNGIKSDDLITMSAYSSTGFVYYRHFNNKLITNIIKNLTDNNTNWYKFINSNGFFNIPLNINFKPLTTLKPIECFSIQKMVQGGIYLELPDQPHDCIKSDLNTMTFIDNLIVGSNNKVQNFKNPFILRYLSESSTYYNVNESDYCKNFFKKVILNCFLDKSSNNVTLDYPESREKSNLLITTNTNDTYEQTIYLESDYFIKDLEKDLDLLSILSENYDEFDKDGNQNVIYSIISAHKYLIKKFGRYVASYDKDNKLFIIKATTAFESSFKQVIKACFKQSNYDIEIQYYEDESEQVDDSPQSEKEFKSWLLSYQVDKVRNDNLIFQDWKIMSEETICKDDFSLNNLHILSHMISLCLTMGIHYILFWLEEGDENVNCLEHVTNLINKRENSNMDYNTIKNLFIKKGDDFNGLLNYALVNKCSIGIVTVTTLIESKVLTKWHLQDDCLPRNLIIYFADCNHVALIKRDFIHRRNNF